MGDQIQVRLDTGGNQIVQALDVTVDENGEISLPLVNQIKAEGMTPSELAERIRASYVPRYYVYCNASVLIATRFIYIGGEIRSPGRYPWTDDLTLTKAVFAASGLTDYANRSKVELTRGKDRRVYNIDDLRRNPQKDVPLQPGDSIWIPRSVF